MSYKIAYIGDPKWSLGALHYHVFKNLPQFNYKVFDWRNPNEIQEWKRVVEKYWLPEIELSLSK